jgi:hypothetical protein
MFAKVKNNIVECYPYSFENLQNDNPFTNYGDNVDFVSIFPDTEAALIHGYELVEVIEESPPTYNTVTQRIVKTDPQLIDGQWKVSWSIESKSAEQLQQERTIQENIIRQSRNATLKDSDWTQLSDSPVDKSAWATYRQALRDVPSQEGFPWEVTWPSKPV